MTRTGGLWNAATGRRDPRPSPGGAIRQRLIHLAWSLILAALMAITLLLEPLDWMIWNLQSRMSSKSPSGEIVFVLGSSSLTDPANPAQRERLAAALDSLRDHGAAAVYLDAVFAEPATDRAADLKLRAALDAWDDRAVIVNRVDIFSKSHSREYTTIPLLASDRPTVWNGVTSDWVAFTWQMPLAYRTSRGVQPSLAAALARNDEVSLAEFTVDYGYRSQSIVTLPLARVAAARGRPDALNLAGKTIVIGMPHDPSQPEMRVPGQFKSPSSFVPIFAAETLRAGPPVSIPGLPILAVFGLLVAGAAMFAHRRARLRAYVAAPAILLLALFAAPALRLHLELSYALPFLILYGILRWRANWQQRVALRDPVTGLPTFRALAAELEENAATGHIVVAKVHGYETILQTLDAPQRSLYIQKLVERLRVGDPGLTIFIEGHYLAWLVDEDTQPKLRAHLEGLRAIFAAPVNLGDQSVDVGITFGAAPLDRAQGERALAMGLAAVEETSEALEPVRIADGTQPADSLWDLSLRSRIDAAMEAGEVFCVYQPKMDISADRLIGVEALVRWEDPERGFIPPLHFVMQCEKAGRMEYLTRYVLQSACTAGKLLHFRGNRITMSVNISATLLTDMRIVGIVRNVLQATGFDARYLVLEITETARIRDLAQARAALNALKSLGAKLSMDDFGSGAANFETLHALPFDEIKIDRQFISGAASSTKARAIAASIVGLGVSARITVVAEGAETASDLQMLRDIGCWQVQGYALARPMPLANLLNLLTSEADTQASTHI
ncbi:EAL domain-containing protein [Qipengyuania sediminis]|uniref:EAL domain-containing protein n=1 Tax=Qipengyuania sediminis TaxID=1532023 RepID=UPI00105A1531|nr:EAL domain-containing protein [Qipengyuania sediminis]